MSAADLTFEGIKKGDRVRLTRANGDLVEVTVTDRANTWIDAGEETTFWANEWEAVELIPSPPPTEKGFYLDKDGDLWEVEKDGEDARWVDLRHDDEFRPADYAPFKRLVEEVAA